MMFKLNRFLLACLALSLTVVSLNSCKDDEVDIQLISGVLSSLTDGSGISGATVTSTDTDNSVLGTTTSDASGFYQVSGVDGGTVTISTANFGDTTLTVATSAISVAFEESDDSKLAAWTASFSANENSESTLTVGSGDITFGGVSGALPVSDGFCDPVSYKGAIDPNGAAWYEGWSFYDNLINGDLNSDALTTGTVVDVTDATIAAAGNTINWTNDNTYVLDGFVFVGDGQTLNIQAGTIIQGKEGQGEDASALIIARGGKINAEGTAAQPIVFTFEGDNGGTSARERGRWGGLIILGNAGLNSTPGESAIEGLPTNEPRGLYGGNDDNDNSGTLRYVSIRHGGSNIGADNEINGLTLGGVGVGTTFEYVEVVANKDDGIEWFGGTARGKYLIVAFCADDALDYDEGYRGRNQYIIVHQDNEVGGADRGGEHDGGTDPETGTPFAIPVFCNVTSIGNPDSRALEFRDNAGGFYYNSLFTGFEDGVRIEDLLGQTQDTYRQFLDGNLGILGSEFDVSDKTFEVNIQ